MPRDNTAKKPFDYHVDYVKGRKIYVVTSANGFTWHHYDQKWRFRRLNDIDTFAYPNPTSAKAAATALNKNMFEY